MKSVSPLRIVRTFLARRSVLTAFAVLGLFNPDAAHAGVIVNFDSLAASGQPNGVGGPVLANYLAGYGITLSGVTSGTSLRVYDARDVYADIQPQYFPN